MTSFFRSIFSASSIILTSFLLISSAMAQSETSSEGLPSLRRTPPKDQSAPSSSVPFWTRNPNNTSPSITIITPSAYGASWGQMGIGVGYQARTRYTSNDDGGLGFAFGLGNPKENVGLQVDLGLTDVSDTFADGGLSLKLHRALPEDFNIAVGIQRVAGWGETDGGSSVYGVVTKKIALKSTPVEPFSELYLTLGVGGGQFRSEDDILNGVDSVGVYGGAALRVIEQVNLITEWSGQDLTVGVSFVPFRNFPLVVTPAFTDITGTAGDGARFILGVGYSISF